MDEQHPLGPTSLSFVKKFDDAVLRVGGHPQGLWLFHAFNFDRMHKGAQGLYTSVKAVFDPHYKVNPGKMVEVWTRYALPLIDTIPPEIMRFGLDPRAVIRTLEAPPGRPRVPRHRIDRARPAGHAPARPRRGPLHAERSRPPTGARRRPRTAAVRLREGEQGRRCRKALSCCARAG